MAFTITAPHHVGTARPDAAVPAVGRKKARQGDVAATVRAQHSVGSRIVGHAVLVVMAFISIFPVYWLYATSLRRPEDAILATPFPWPISVANFVHVWQQIPIGNMLVHTFGMALAVSVCQLLVAIFAAYGFAMWEFPGKNVLFLLFLGSWLVPFQVTMIPNYVLIAQWGLLGTIAGVVVPNMCSAFAVMLMRQHMQSFPRELLDAARMDGRHHWSTLWTVVMPNMRHALAALGIMLFIEAWNNYLWPALILAKQPNSLIQMGIRSFLGEAGDDWGGMMAAAGLACIPIFLIYIFLQRYIVDAFVRSGLR
ncbi:carbohydrate ABC transporter permease [Raineyella sp. LH-20]|uniref:carbohydrate ABC transporter permease n=1 Tax=Raineyella sp. LH-20 TaxID=3081204 RepID=UPI0029533491|nr:carbohydrate ABC transporter permease [Raineyella sp. LH-20]WOP19514.1 carbohydrate ABC transporter permease [Raineyella sp. LH-20]